jgi:hypothetical protein
METRLRELVVNYLASHAADGDGRQAVPVRSAG